MIQNLVRSIRRHLADKTLVAHLGVAWIVLGVYLAIEQPSAGKTLTAVTIFLIASLFAILVDQFRSTIQNRIFLGVLIVWILLSIFLVVLLG